MTDEIKPWTIKNIPPEDRNAAIAAAERERMDIGPWICRAIRTQIQADLGQDRAPVVVNGPLSPAPTTLDDIGRMIELARELAAVTGKPAPRTITGPTTKLLRVHVKMAADRV